MTPLDSSSEAESTNTTTTTTTMENISTTRNNNSKHRRNRKNSHDSEEDQDGGDPQVWRSLNSSFKQVQSVLDRNRVLIEQVNENHQSKIPDNMVKNVALIQEINGNISKVVSLYSDMSNGFSCAFNQRNKNCDEERDCGEA